MTIRFLSSAGIPTEIYAVEVEGRCYSAGEVEGIITGHFTATLSTTSVSPAQIACQATEADGSACAICRTPITQKSRGRRRKYCEGCVERLGHQAPASVSQENARKKP